MQWEGKLSEHKIGGWGTVYAAGLQGNGSQKRGCVLTDACMNTC